MGRVADKSIIEQLQQQIEKLQGNQTSSVEYKTTLGLGAIEKLFPESYLQKVQCMN